ncbi:MAG: helix-turn-helix domain-containing protein, partial [Myxococcota bacterium]
MARTTRQDWIEAAWSALAQGGPMEHLRIEQLARSMATSKGSFYWHFQDRAALLEALLQRWEETATAAIVREVEAASKAEALALLWELGRSQEGLGPEVAIRLWARREPAVEHR